VAFALTRHPGAALVSTAEGAFVGSMVGGIAGGVVAYFEELQQRAGGRQEAMIANHIAYMESDSRKYDVLVRISNESIQREEQFYADIKRQLNEQGADIMRIKESVRKNELIFNERWNKIKRDDVDYKDSKKVRDVVSSKIGIGANPVVAENTAKMSQQINNVYDNIIRRQREREEIYIQYPALRSNG